jgi:hypothetical protein
LRRVQRREGEIGWEDEAAFGVAAKDGVEFAAIFGGESGGEVVDAFGGGFYLDVDAASFRKRPGMAERGGEVVVGRSGSGGDGEPESSFVETGLEVKRAFVAGKGPVLVGVDDDGRIVERGCFSREELEAAENVFKINSNGINA